jgi:N-sulfoglucosamine sulfohydrolase
MKCNLTDHGIGVMMILRSPGGFAGGRACDAMVSQIDVVPTICELAGIDAPPWVEGRSLLPLVRGEADEIHEEIFAEVSYHVAYEPMRAVRTRRWKYIRRFHDRRTPMLNNCDDSPSKTLLVESGWRDRPVEAEQLFDLAFDPAEACNLAAEPAHAATLARMRGRLEAWMRRTNDPLLRGPVPAPSGAKVGDPDALSPGERLRVVP